jgi:hypothetical protein
MAKNGKKNGTLTLTQDLPGASKVSTALLDQAVAELNRRYRSKGLETARSVGEYVLETFFGGDPENFRRGGTAHVSFRELGKREDLQVSFLFIWNSVAVVDQLRLLPADIAEALPLSHHKLLLPIKDESKKLELAKSAVHEGLAKRAFEERVRKLRDKGKDEAKAGRPPLPAFAKAVTALRKVVKIAASQHVGEKTFEHLPKVQAKALLKELEQQVEALSKLAGRVREGLEG